jgi:hypothetical protein
VYQIGYCPPSGEPDAKFHVRVPPGGIGTSCGGVDRGREQRGPETPWYVPRRSGAAYGFGGVPAWSGIADGSPGGLGCRGATPR